MRKLICKKCKVHRFCVKNASGDRLVVVVDEMLNIIPINADESLSGYDLSILYCLGCSWSGSKEQLSK